MPAETTHGSDSSSHGDAAAPSPSSAQSADATLAFPSSEPAAPAVPVAVSIPGYEILGVLGRGGMGTVYKARQCGFDRLVALKMIHAGGHAGDDLARFRTEAQAVACLQHPNIVQVFEIGEHEGWHFFTFEFCAGGSLEKKLNGVPLPPAEAARLVETLAHAVHAAHQHRILHRDLKPSNILLEADGTPKITDFGLAKKLDEVGQTASGAVLGTPSYMAPEQARGRLQDLGPATDVYGLGAILYELLTGRPPFKAATTLETIVQVMSAEPAAPARLQPGTPCALETICLKALAKEPGRRYAGAQELADDLKRFLAGEPIRARPVGAPSASGSRRGATPWWQVSRPPRPCWRRPWRWSRSSATFRRRPRWAPSTGSGKKSFASATGRISSCITRSSARLRPSAWPAWKASERKSNRCSRRRGALKPPRSIARTCARRRWPPWATASALNPRSWRNREPPSLLWPLILTRGRSRSASPTVRSGYGTWGPERC